MDELIKKKSILYLIICIIVLISVGIFIIEDSQITKTGKVVDRKIIESHIIKACLPSRTCVSDTRVKIKLEDCSAYYIDCASQNKVCHNGYCAYPNLCYPADGQCKNSCEYDISQINYINQRELELTLSLEGQHTLEIFPE